jgi:GNS1/SUR4 family
MENRKPFKLRGIIVAYNFLQVLLSFYLFWEVGMVGWFGNYNWRCQPVDFSSNEMGMRVSLRKKNQVA